MAVLHVILLLYSFALCCPELPNSRHAAGHHIAYVNFIVTHCPFKQQAPSDMVLLALVSQRLLVVPSRRFAAVPKPVVHQRQPSAPAWSGRDIRLQPCAVMVLP